MIFEKSPLCSNAWQTIDEATLRRETTGDERHMMIFHKATVRTATAKYRRRIPTVIIDWAKPETAPA